MTPDILDEAVTAAQEAGNHAYRDGADDATCWRLGLAAALPVLNTAKDAETTALRDALGSIRALVAKYHERDDSLPADLVDEVYALTSAASLRGEQGE